MTDCASAIFDGTDAVMTSGETAMGEYPEKTVRWLGTIIAETEAHKDEFKPNI